MYWYYIFTIHIYDWIKTKAKRTIIFFVNSVSIWNFRVKLRERERERERGGAGNVVLLHPVHSLYFFLQVLTRGDFELQFLAEACDLVFSLDQPGLFLQGKVLVTVGTFNCLGWFPALLIAESYFLSRRISNHFPYIQIHQEYIKNIYWIAWWKDFSLDILHWIPW